MDDPLEICLFPTYADLPNLAMLSQTVLCGSGGSMLKTEQLNLAAVVGEVTSLSEPGIRRAIRFSVIAKRCNETRLSTNPNPVLHRVARVCRHQLNFLLQL